MNKWYQWSFWCKCILKEEYSRLNLSDRYLRRLATFLNNGPSELLGTYRYTSERAFNDNMLCSDLRNSPEQTLEKVNISWCRKNICDILRRPATPTKYLFKTVFIQSFLIFSCWYRFICSIWPRKTQKIWMKLDLYLHFEYILNVEEIAENIPNIRDTSRYLRHSN